MNSGQADDSKLVAGLNRAVARLKAFGASVSAIGMKLATLGGAALAPMLGAAKMFGSTGDDLAKMCGITGRCSHEEETVRPLDC